MWRGIIMRKYPYIKLYLSVSNIYIALSIKHTISRTRLNLSLFQNLWGWSGGAKVLGKLQCRGVLLIWIIVGQGPTALAVGAGGGCLDIFTLIYPFSPLSPSLWETARYRLKYCLKGPLNPKQPTNQSKTCGFIR